jgi:iron(III) transport system permease protein
MAELKKEIEYSLPQPKSNWFTPIYEAYFQGKNLFYTILLAGYALLVLYPILLLFINSFRDGKSGQDVGWGFTNWIEAFSHPSLLSALTNTLSITFTVQAISITVSVVIAWIIARTNLPGRSWIEFSFWIVFFMPTLPLVQSWILLFDPYVGVVNKFFASIPYLSWIHFNIFSWKGIVWVHLVTGTIAVKVILLTPAFRNMDSSLEEASRVNGANMFTTFTKVIIPILLPSILIVLILGTIRSLEAFEIEMILGGPEKIDVFSTQIYRMIHDANPQYGAATALASVILTVMVPLIVLQQWITRRGGHATISGKFKTQKFQLGKFRWFVFSIMLIIVVIMTVIPLLSLLVGTFMSMYGFFNIDNAFTLANWKLILTRDTFLQALKNTLFLATLMAIISMLLYSITAYIIVRTKYVGRNLLDFVVWVPYTIPGIIISLGMLWLFLGTKVFQPLYGTIWVLLIALILTGITTGIQIIKSNLLQLGNELEEASLLSGASWWYTYRRIVLPNIAPAMIAVGIFCFSIATKSTASIVLLTTNDTMPLSILQLMYMLDGSYEASSVVGVIIMVLTIGVALIVRALGVNMTPK